MEGGGAGGEETCPLGPVVLEVPGPHFPSASYDQRCQVPSSCAPSVPFLRCPSFLRCGLKQPLPFPPTYSGTFYV